MDIKELIIGDRIVVTSTFSFDSECFKEGSTGTVLEIDACHVGIEWDEFNPRLHSLTGKCPNGHGWFFDKSVISNMAVANDFEEWDTSDMSEYFLSLKT